MSKAAFIHLSSIVIVVFVLLCVNAFTVANSISLSSVRSASYTCVDHERSALLRFKHSFRTDCTWNDDPEVSLPRLKSWVGGANADCCLWDGVVCDEITGHVIALDLGYGCIHGTFPPNSGLFSLTHLQSLDLSGNDFNLSRIPSEISMLPNLTYLDLSNSRFCCQIPHGIAKLSNLSYVDISDNYLSGSIPSSFGNMTMLSGLYLSNINMSGKFVSSNIPWWLPKLHNNLQKLDLSYVKLPSEMPSLLANFTNLIELYLSNTQLTGPVPKEFANLTQLQILYLDSNNLEGPIPPWVSQHMFLNLSSNNLFGNFDIFLNSNISRLSLSGVKLTFSLDYRCNTSKLSELELSSCNLTDFPSFLRNQDALYHLDLSNNNIKGNIPQWFSDITRESLLRLSLAKNFLTGFEQPLTVIPWTHLRVLELGENEFQGELPSLPNTLGFCDFSNNRLISLNHTSFCNARLVYLDLSFNNLSGEIPDCREHQFFRSLQVMHLHTNNLRGVIPNKVCNASSLISLDLSNNNLSGRIPSCIGNQLGSKSLQFLNLQNNSFLGTIPPTFTILCKLEMINLSQNKLQGELPRSLSNCTMLVELDIGNNNVNDTFPSWLGSISTLHVLVLRHNNFHGSIGNPISDLDFLSLHIIDLSHNHHVGNLPSLYIQNMHAMRDSNENNPASYAMAYSKFLNFSYAYYNPYKSFQFSIMITNKGSERLYPKISKAFRVVDFSSNHFTGGIPDIIGDLKGLQVLNLSNNNLNGEIPSSLANITDLESLDLSQNKLFGPIPQQLSQITSLEFLNVSYNDLVGPLPQGKQFDTFDNTSYQGNPSLCGSPLSKKCKDVDSTPPLSRKPSDKDSEESEFIDWVIRSLGCLSGCIVGFIMGKLYITDKYHEWFVDTFGRQRLHRRECRAPRHGL